MNAASFSAHLLKAAVLLLSAMRATSATACSGLCSHRESRVLPILPKLTISRLVTGHLGGGIGTSYHHTTLCRLP